MRYAFIGLGTLGGYLAASLLREGFALTVHDRDPAAMAPLIADDAIGADTPAAAVEGADAVITCLPSPAISESVLDQILPAVSPGATWIEMSTLGRDEIRRLAGKARDAGIACLECPVTGGVHLAALGEITVLIGGDAALADRHRPALQAMGDKIFHLGDIGAASVVKVITNMLAFIHLAADAEALMLAKRAGIDLKTAWEAIAASSGNSFVHETEGQLILSGSYDIGFTMDLALKDLGFALDFSRELDVPLDLASQVTQNFRRGRAAYGGEAQSPMIAKLLEDLLDTDLRADGFPDRLTG